MNEVSREYFKIELEHFRKLSELQFTHFMGVFYFWIGVVAFPATAGLLNTDINDIKPPQANLAYLFLLIAILSLFISAKMFDIRHSQLTYMTHINEIRDCLYDSVKHSIPSYSHPYTRDTNLRNKALFGDFGKYMALVMSIVNALYFGGSIFLLGKVRFFWPSSIIWFLVGVLLYVLIIRRIPEPKSESKSDHPDL